MPYPASIPVSIYPPTIIIDYRYHVQDGTRLRLSVGLESLCNSLPLLGKPLEDQPSSKRANIHLTFGEVLCCRKVTANSCCGYPPLLHSTPNRTNGDGKNAGFVVSTVLYLVKGAGARVRVSYLLSSTQHGNRAGGFITGTCIILWCYSQKFSWRRSPPFL